MSLHPEAVDQVPESTARVAKSAFPGGNPYLMLRDNLGIVFHDELFAHLFPRRGQSAESPWRLALVTIMQFAEDLSDRQAADAVRARIDWKYALSLDLEDPGFDASVLCEFRGRLLSSNAEALLLDTLLAWCREKKLIKAGGRQRTDSTHVLAAIRAINRYELVLETMRAALDDLAAADPEWLRANIEPEWAKRYVRCFEPEPKLAKPEERLAFVRTVGEDGMTLLRSVYADNVPTSLRRLPAVVALRRIWIQNYQQTEHGLEWREADNIPSATCFLSSPYDADARLSRKGSTCWVGYKVHLTETCDDECPPLVTHVATTIAPAPDGSATPEVHKALRRKDLLPETHIVDAGYLVAGQLVSSSKEYGVDLLGPPRPDVHRQARSGSGFDVSHFQIDWIKKQATCPEKQTSTSWSPALDSRTTPVIKIKFSSKICRDCTSREACFHSNQKHARRCITVRSEEQHKALQAARRRATTKEYAKDYARRSGIEGTISRAVRTCGIRRSRYVGMPKVHLGNLISAVAMNYLRVCEWLADTPRAKTRKSPFKKLVEATI